MPFRLRADLEALDVPLENLTATPGIELRLVGGMPSERLDLTFTLSEDGTLAANVLDRTGGREARTVTTPQASRIVLARDAILGSGILRVEATLPPIPPDSVIGELRLSNGTVLSQWQFVGDVDQAGALHDPPPLQLIRAVGPLMALGKDALQFQTVNPNLVADAFGPLFIAPADFDLEETPEPQPNVVLYNLRPEPLDISLFTLRDQFGGVFVIPPGTLLAPHGIFRMPRPDGGGLEAAMMDEGGGGGSMLTVVGRDGQELARRVYPD